MTRDLVIDALTMAIWRRWPAPGLFVHRDARSPLGYPQTHGMVERLKGRIAELLRNT